MQEFKRLQVWKEPRMYNRLKWYYAVANNNKPAKYLISRRIRCNLDLTTSTVEELWEEHETLTGQFLKLWYDIKSDQVEIQEIPKVTPSLMDLNLELANRMLQKCNFCRWNCEIDRTQVDINSDAKSGTCQLGEETRIGSYFHHRGEELIFRGTSGSGTIFFTSCNMRCSFCQNGNISKDKDNGRVTTTEELRAIIWLLRMEGCHNINFVGGDPTIHFHTIIRAIHSLSLDSPDRKTIDRISRMKSDSFMHYNIDEENAKYKGEFNAPMLWNSNFFMSDKAMRILRTVIDIWLPDFKFGTNKKCATRLSRTPWYFETVSKNHKMIYDWGEDFSIRHLIMPNHVECCTKEILDWVKHNMPDVPINIMDQYHPDSYTNPSSRLYNERYEEISRRPTKDEILECFKYAKSLDLNFESITFEKNIRGYFL